MARARLAPVIGSCASIQPEKRLEVLLLGGGDLMLDHTLILSAAPPRTRPPVGTATIARSVSLPLKPPIEPQLARTGKELPLGDQWAYEPKFDGFRAIAFVDGDDFTIQSRAGKPLERYFPELSFPPGRYVIDGEIVIDAADGQQDFGALQQRIHPAESRVKMLAEQTPARYVAFDLLARDDEDLLPLQLRRAPGRAGGAGPRRDRSDAAHA